MPFAIRDAWPPLLKGTPSSSHGGGVLHDQLCTISVNGKNRGRFEALCGFIAPFTPLMVEG